MEVLTQNIEENYSETMTYLSNALTKGAIDRYYLDWTTSHSFVFEVVNRVDPTTERHKFGVVFGHRNGDFCMRDSGTGSLKVSPPPPPGVLPRPRETPLARLVRSIVR